VSELTESGTSKFADLDGLKSHYHDAGKGDAVVLCTAAVRVLRHGAIFGKTSANSQRSIGDHDGSAGFGKSGGGRYYEGERIGAFAARALHNNC